MLNLVYLNNLCLYNKVICIISNSLIFYYKLAPNLFPQIKS
uniref:Uncharacterized protein n=1 Tax=Siphoviridae sp. ctxMM9 TaxID=2827973 RepID=A0A8S5T826_9CAUD|nr:MAG TPA: hypothetical protein [Siphoviridae sp. ctxMM9]